MIKLCGNLFYKPKYGSDADSMMLKRLFRTVTTVLMCLAAISFSAYAFFSSSVTSGNNIIQASNFSTTIVIKGSDDSLTQGKIQSHTFSPGLYTVTITADDDTTGTGFGVITVNGTTYYTQQLGRDVNAPGGERREISFVLDVKGASTIAFESCWGTNSHYDSVAESEFYIKNAPQKIIVVNATQGVAGNTEENETQQTEPDSTTESTVESATVETTVPTTNIVETAHIVQEGESLSLIAKKYDTTAAKLATYNDVADPSIIQPGQEILIPPADEEMPEATEATEATLGDETQSATETTAAPLQ